jgi:glycosyltransferase involved in cell wall biosynthesis
MPAAPHISIIIPTYNRRALLAECIASVQAQTFTGWELIVVNDCSPDDTWAWLAGQAQTEPRLHPLQPPRNLKNPAARNFGLQHARGQYALFLDDDDRLPPDALAIHLSALQRHPRAIASMGEYACLFPDGALQPNGFVRRERALNAWDGWLFGWACTTGQTLLRSETIRSAGGWDESRPYFGEDFATFIHLLRQHPIVALPQITLHYRIHAGQSRPLDKRLLFFDILEEGIMHAPPRLRRRARRIVDARKLHLRAVEAGQQRKFAAALWFYLRTLWRAPRLLAHPLTRRRLFLPLAKWLGR